MTRPMIRLFSSPATPLSAFPATRSAHSRIGGMLLSCLALVPGLAAAQGTPGGRAAYLDNRSTPAALIRSLYNAIGLKQYARAWSYFAHPKPAASYDAFTKGYAETGPIHLVIGKVDEEGAAGSTYATVPVAIAAEEGAQAVWIFAGCYVTRMQDPQIAAPDFQPMQITTGDLVARNLADGAKLSSVLPTSCGEDGTPHF